MNTWERSFSQNTDCFSCPPQKDKKAVRSLQWLFRYSHLPISHWWQPRERNHSSGPMFHQTPVFFHHSPSLIFFWWCNGCVSYWPFCLSCLPLQLSLFLSSPDLLLVVPYRGQVESRSVNCQMTSFNLWTRCCLCSTIASCCYKSLKFVLDWKAIRLIPLTKEKAFCRNFIWLSQQSSACRAHLPNTQLHFV